MGFLGLRVGWWGGKSGITKNGRDEGKKSVGYSFGGFARLGAYAAMGVLKLLQERSLIGWMIRKGFGDHQDPLYIQATLWGCEPKKHPGRILQWGKRGVRGRGEEKQSNPQPTKKFFYGKSPPQ